MNEGRGQYASNKKTKQYVEIRDKTSLLKKNISIDKLLGLKYNVLVHIRTVLIQMHKLNLKIVSLTTFIFEGLLRLNPKSRRFFFNASASLRKR